MDTPRGISEIPQSRGCCSRGPTLTHAPGSREGIATGWLLGRSGALFENLLGQDDNSLGGQPGRIGGVEETEGSILHDLGDEFAPNRNFSAVGRGVPGLVVSVEIAHHQGIAPKVSLEEGREVRRVIAWAEGCGER